MKRVLTAVVLIPLVLMLVFRGPEWVMALVLAAVAYFCTSEYFSLLRARGTRGLERTTTIVIVVALLLPMIPGLLRSYFDFPTHLGLYLYLSPLSVLLPFLAVGPLLLLTASFRMPVEESLPGAAASFFAAAYIGLSLSLLWTVWSDGHQGRLFTFYVLVVIWASDISAFFVGRKWGRRKLAPILSPGKTWEGAIASLVAAMGLGTLLWYELGTVSSFLARYNMTSPYEALGPSETIAPLPLWLVLLTTALINVTAQLGDLAESAIKRGAGVKDSGAILPGHGGMLDRVDALLGAAPVAFIAFILLVPRVYAFR